MEGKAQIQGERHNLGNLPQELLLGITTIGPCESALALSQVNKRLSSICKQPVIYRDIIEDRLEYDSIARNGNGIKWHNTASVDLQADVSVWARWSLADSRARAASGDNDVALKNASLELLEWEPHLL